MPIFAIVIIISCSCVLPISAVGNNANSLSSYEMSAQRLVGMLTFKSNLEVVDDILRAAGVSDVYISEIPEKIKMEIYNSKAVNINVQYGKIDENGNETIMSKEDCLREANALEEKKIKEGDLVTTESQGIYQENSLTDAYFEKFILCNERSDLEKGAFATIVVYTWLSMPLVRGNDVVGILSERLVFNISDISVIYSYEKTVNNNGNKTTERLTFSETYDDLKNTEKLSYAPHYVAYVADLPNNSSNPFTDLYVTYNNYGILIAAPAVVDEPSSTLNFNVYGEYHHQTIQWNPTISVGDGGTSFSVAPTLAYSSPSKISLKSFITYIP